MNKIWDNDVCEAFENILAEDPEIDEEQAWEDAYLSVSEWLADEVTNLDVEAKGSLIAVGTLERWNGSCKAYKELDTCNIGKAIEKVIEAFSGDNAFNVYEEAGKLLVSQTGHDNPVSPSVFEIRELTCDMDELDDYNQCSLIANSKPCGCYACEVYGW